MTSREAALSLARGLRKTDGQTYREEHFETFGRAWRDSAFCRRPSLFEFSAERLPNTGFPASETEKSALPSIFAWACSRRGNRSATTVLQGVPSANPRQLVLWSPLLRDRCCGRQCSLPCKLPDLGSKRDLCLTGSAALHHPNKP